MKRWLSPLLLMLVFIDLHADDGSLVSSESDDILSQLFLPEQPTAKVSESLISEKTTTTTIAKEPITATEPLLYPDETEPTKEKTSTEEKQEYDNEISTPITWTQLHRLQALYAPEGIIQARFRDLEGEEGTHGTIGVRWPFRQNFDMSYLGELSQYRSASQNARETLLGQSLRIHWNRLEEEVLLEIETGHDTRLGGTLAWQKSLKPGAGFAISLSSKTQHENTLSLIHGEIIDQAALSWSFQLPSELFFSGEASKFQSRLVHAAGAHGQGERLTLNVGFNLAAQPDQRMAWQFYNNDLLYRDQLRQYLQVKLTQGFEHFDAGSDYISKVARTTNAKGQSVYLSWGHPFSQHLGLEGTIYCGQDLERQLKLGKIRGFQSRLLWVPTHISRFELSFNSSNENTGIVKGSTMEYITSYHVNF